MGWLLLELYSTITYERNEVTVRMDGLCFPLKERAEG